MQVPLIAPVRALRHDHHRYQANNIRNQNEDTDGGIRISARDGLDGLWHPKTRDVQAHKKKKMNAREMQNTRVDERLEHAEFPAVVLECRFSSQRVTETYLFFSREKGRIGRPVRKKSKGQETTSDRRQRLENQEPPPAAQTKPVHMIKNPARHRSAHNARRRQRGQK